MNILEKIIARKQQEVALQKATVGVAVLEKSPYFSRPCHSLKKSLLAEGTSGIIAEIKRKSPSQGIIHPDVRVDRIAKGYEQAGASAISILTDTDFFGGSNEDVLRARPLVSIPILRKEFMIDEYQVLEAKAIGADVILLIAACLSSERIRELTQFAHRLGLEVLLEVHDAVELQNNLGSGADMMGVNNRNLKTFEVSVDVSKQLAGLIPDAFIKVSESGIESVSVINELRTDGYQGFLMGQNFMKHPKPEEACREFIQQLNNTGYAR